VTSVREGAFWSGYPGADYSDSFDLWMTMVEQAVGATIDYYDALRRHATDNLSIGFSPYPDLAATKT